MTREMGSLPRGQAGRMFRTIVVLGSGLALGCGGRTVTPDEEGDTDASGSGGAPSGVGGSTGGTSHAGGSGGAGTGGLIPGSGGQDGSGGDCPAEQWDCWELAWMSGEHEELECSYVMPDNCTCDASRPIKPEDCPEETAHTCLAAGFDSDGAALPELVPFACKCVPFDPATQDCTAACSAYGESPRGGALCDETDPYINILCGCELPILR